MIGESVQARVRLLCGGPPVTLASAQVRPMGIAVDAEYLYWVDQGGTVMKRLK
jgi:hypothetical protein